MFGIPNLFYAFLPQSIVQNITGAMPAQQQQKLQNMLQQNVMQYLAQLETDILTAQFKFKLLLTPFGGITTGISTLLNGFFGTLALVADDARERGESLRSAISTSLNSIRDAFSALMDGRILTPLSAGRIERGLAKALAYRGDEVLRLYTTDLMNAANLEADKAAEISSMFFRMGGFNAQIVKDLETAARGIQSKFGIPMRDVILQLADNANVAAQYIGRSAREMANAALIAQRSGISLSQANDVANKLVGDFEQTLIMQSELQSMFGAGFDLTEALYASQFGTPEQVAEILSAQIRGLGIQNINQLPRSIRNALTNSFGFSDQDLQNILQGAPPGMAEGSAEAKAATGLERFTEGLANAIGGLKTFTAALIGLTTFFTFYAGFKWLNPQGAIQSTAQKVFGSLLTGAGAQAAGAAAAGSAGAAAAGGVGSALGSGLTGAAAAVGAAGSKVMPFLKNVGKLGLGGLAGTLGSMGINAATDGTEYEALGNLLSSAVMWGSMGASIGSLVPVIGPAVGALLGGTAGMVYSAMTSPSQAKLNETIEETMKLRDIKQKADQRASELLQEQNSILRNLAGKMSNIEVNISTDKIEKGFGRRYK